RSTRGKRCRCKTLAWRGTHKETFIFRTEFRLRSLSISLCHLGGSGSGRGAFGHFQRGLSAFVTQPGSVLSLPAGAGRSREIHAIVGEPSHFAQGRGHRGEASDARQV